MSHPTVLVVEDDPVVAKLLQMNFELDDYCVVSATNGDDGLRLARRDRPDVIILDVMLPSRHDGLEVASRLKAGPDTCDIPIILLSARAQPSDVAAGQAVADRYITKPFDPLALLDLVATLTKDRQEARR